MPGRPPVPGRAARRHALCLVLGALALAGATPAHAADGVARSTRPDKDTEVVLPAEAALARD